MVAIPAAIRHWSGRLAHHLDSLLSRVSLRSLACLALLVCLSLPLSACSGSAGGLSGNYVDDTVRVARALQTTIAIPQDDPSHPEAEAQARQLINDYMARYRPRRDVNGLASFTTMQTALNSLAGHYANYANRPLPDALRTRLDRELSRAADSVTRGA